MPKTKTIGTILASVMLGTLTFFLSGSKKMVKKREVTSFQNDTIEDTEDLFI